MSVSSKEDTKIAAKVINSSPVVKKAILISISKEDARFPHPLDVLNSLFVIAKTEGVVGIDKDITALALNEVIDNAVPDLSTKYEGDVSFQIFYNKH